MRLAQPLSAAATATASAATAPGGASSSSSPMSTPASAAGCPVPGHKVLLFCTMTRALDLIEEYLAWRGIAGFKKMLLVGWEGGLW